jgi:hypothetical protein
MLIEKRIEKGRERLRLRLGFIFDREPMKDRPKNLVSFKISQEKGETGLSWRRNVRQLVAARTMATMGKDLCDKIDYSVRTSMWIVFFLLLAGWYKKKRSKSAMMA